MGSLQDVFLAKISSLVQRGRRELRGVRPLPESRQLNQRPIDTIKESGSPADYAYQSKVIVVGTSITQIAVGNPQRIYLGVSSFGTTVWFGQTVIPGATPQAAYAVAVASPTFEIFWERHRVLVTQPFVATGTGAAASVTVTEVWIVPGH